MPLVSFQALMVEAQRGQYAVGYFESWNLESLLAVADAAEAARSPVMLGFSGIHLTRPDRERRDPLSVYAAMGREICRRLSVPACLVFNECSRLDAVFEAIDLGFSLVMFSDEKLTRQELADKLRQITQRAHAVGIAVEGEMNPLAGVAGQLRAVPDDLHVTEPAAAHDFVHDTQIDALAVNVGQAHLHGRHPSPLNLDQLAELTQAVPVPLVLHGASSIPRSDLQGAIRLGVGKINVGSALKQAYFHALRKAASDTPEDYNPYEVLGSGLSRDVLTAGRLAMQQAVEDLMHCFGGAGKAQLGNDESTNAWRMTK